MIIIIKNHSYEGGDKLKSTLMELAKQSFKNKPTCYAIIALEKRDTLEMRNDIFDSNIALMVAKNNYEAKGFKVYWISRGGISI